MSTPPAGPSSQLFGRTFTAPRRPGELDLTFDDGPNPAWTRPSSRPAYPSTLSPRHFSPVGNCAKSENRRSPAASPTPRPSHRQPHLEPPRPLPHPHPRKSLRPDSPALPTCFPKCPNEPIRYFQPPCRRYAGPTCSTPPRRLGLMPRHVERNDHRLERAFRADKITPRLIRKIRRNQSRQLHHRHRASRRRPP